MRKRRRELDMTQAELAKALGLPGPSSVCDWETGRRGGPRPEMFAQLCRVLDVTADWLLGLEVAS